MSGYTIKELEGWDERIKKVVESFGLDPYPQIFEMCDHNQMIGYMAYSGMPSRYPHWSFGKQFEKQKTLYDYGIAGLPYEMVINSNPCLAYLMQDNSLLLQILTIAHVYAHNDFFKNNFMFKNTHALYTLETFKAHADRLRKYYEHPKIGIRKVEDILDAAHALSLNCSRFPPVQKKLQDDEEESENERDYYRHSTFGPPRKADEKPNDVDKKVPSEPDQNILLFIRDHNRNMPEWAKDILTIVHEEARYFVPQIETKIMNEGWASTWHYRIIHELDLPQELLMEFFVRHNQVLRPIPRGMNPYYIGFKLFEDIEKRWDEPSDEEREEFGRKGGQGRKRIFQVREADRDESFIRQYLTRDLMHEMDLFQHEARGKDRIVTKVSSEEDWETVKQTIISSTGMNSFPVIQVHDSGYKDPGSMLLVHENDGRELDEEYTRKTLLYVNKLWNSPVTLDTHIGGKKVQMTCNNQDDEIKTV